MCSIVLDCSEDSVSESRIVIKIAHYDACGATGHSLFIPETSLRFWFSSVILICRAINEWNFQMRRCSGELQFEIPHFFFHLFGQASVMESFTASLFRVFNSNQHRQKISHQSTIMLPVATWILNFFWKPMGIKKNKQSSLLFNASLAFLPSLLLLEDCRCTYITGEDVQQHRSSFV